MSLTLHNTSHSHTTNKIQVAQGPSHSTILHILTQPTRFKLPKVHHTPQYFTCSYNQQDSSCPRSITLHNTSHSCITNKIQVAQDVTNIQTSKYNFNVENGIQADCDIIFLMNIYHNPKKASRFLQQPVTTEHK